MDITLATLIGSKSNDVILSGETAFKQKKNHPDVIPEDYLEVMRNLSNYQILIRHKGGKKLLFFVVNSKLYEVIIKATKTGDELYLVSMYRTDEGKINSEARKGEILDDKRQK